MRRKTKNEIKAFAAPYIEATDQLGQLFLPQVWAFKKVMGTLYTSQKQISFQEYVEGVAYYFSTNSIDKKDAKALTKKVSDSDNYETMTSILDAVFFSHSKVSRAILGIISGKYMCDDKLDYEDMVLIGALKDIFDVDLDYFWRYSSNKPSNVNDTTLFLEQYSETDRLIVEKLQNAGILGRDLAGNRLGGASLRYVLTSVSQRLKGYLEAVRPVWVDN